MALEMLGVAASVVAVLELSAKIGSACLQYSYNVRSCRADIDELQSEISNVRGVFEELQDLISSPNGAKLLASQELLEAVHACSMHLDALSKKLYPDKKGLAASLVGNRALRWPFDRKEVDKVLAQLQRRRAVVFLALQTNQTRLMLEMSQRAVLEKLPSALGAAFDSHIDEFDVQCHPDTRLELLRQIREWPDYPKGKCIFWLNGMAGTGKSTISRTVAQHFADIGQLGASFFFKRGEGERGTASRFFSSIAAQLVRSMPQLSHHIREAIEKDARLCEKPLREQFDKLFFRPLSEIDRVQTPLSKLVIVVDALDECDRVGDVRTILHLLSQTHRLSSVRVRTFLTSRPELPIRLGFRQMPTEAHQDVFLQEIPRDTIEHDIAVFLTLEFTKIKDDYNCECSSESVLPEEWPGNDSIQTLARMAVPLFIFAATVIRFVGDKWNWNPNGKLDAILKYQSLNQESQMDQTYLPVLQQLVYGRPDADRERVGREFEQVVGTIAVLATPLSIPALGKLLKLPKEDIKSRLHLLHSVLSIPSNEDLPVRLLHLSFRDFLMDPQSRGKKDFWFWVDEKKVHAMIATCCLDILTKSGCLRENICSLESPGRLRSEIDNKVIDKYLSLEIRYACRYWVYHLGQSGKRIHDDGDVHSFLRQHFLHWLEALSLMEKTAGSPALIDGLHGLVAESDGTAISRFLFDARRFLLQNRWITTHAPLQLYSSAILFSPEKSIIKDLFRSAVPRWIPNMRELPATRSSEAQGVHGHSSAVYDIAFSSDGHLLASASYDTTIRLWNAATGLQQEILRGHNDAVRSVAFSPTNPTLASASDDRTVRLWSTASGAELRILEGHLNWVRVVVFSSNGELLASASDDRTVRVWSAMTGDQLQMLEISDMVDAVDFSPDALHLAVGSDDGIISFWNATTGQLLRKIAGHSDMINAVAFSPDGKLLASVSDDKTVKLWSLARFDQLHILKDHADWVRAVRFSPNGQLLASASQDQTIRLWNPETGQQFHVLQGHQDMINAVAFSPDSQLLASASSDTSIRLWNTLTGEQVRIVGDFSHAVNVISISPDRQLLASASENGRVTLWNIATCQKRQMLKGHSDLVNALTFSSDSQLIASGSSDSTVRVWNTTTGEELQTLKGHRNMVNAVTFSDDAQLLASSCSGNTVRVWEVSRGKEKQILESQIFVNTIQFSYHGQLLAVATSAGNAIEIWDLTEGKRLHTLTGHRCGITAMTFLSNNEVLVSTSYDKSIRLWAVATGAELKMLELDVVIFELRLSGDNQFLETDRGVLTFNSNYDYDLTLTPDSHFPHGLFVDNDWVTWNNRNLLWLPWWCRGTWSASSGDGVAIGGKFGEVYWIDIRDPFLGPNIDS